MTAAVDAAVPAHLQARTLLTQLPRLVAQASPEQQRAWTEHQEGLEALAHLLESGDASAPAPGSWAAATHAQWVQFGTLLRDRRDAAGFSRVQLGRKAKLSDCTIKFTETARHPPSRSTVIRLLGVPELRLSWAEVPGHPTRPAPVSGEEGMPWLEDSARPSPLNCWLAPHYDPLALLAERTQFLHGAGGYLEQTSAYLDPYSAAAYLAMCQNAPLVTEPRSRLPLREIAQHGIDACRRVRLQVLALGSGDGVSETQLVDHLLSAGAPQVELCLLDISQPLLASAYRHGVDRLARQPRAQVWALQGNFHHLPPYPVLHRPAARRPRQLFTLLGGTLAHLDHEPRFLQHSLLNCAVDDLLLLDVPVASVSCTDAAELKRCDRLFAQGVPAPYAAWLAGPLWRYCPQVEGVDFHWDLKTHCPVPGSYALHAVAMVKSSQRADRRFSLFRLGRYHPAQLAQCLSEIGWQEIGAELYGDEHSLRLYRKRPAGQRARLGGASAWEGT